MHSLDLGYQWQFVQSRHRTQFALPRRDRLPSLEPLTHEQRTRPEEFFQSHATSIYLFMIPSRRHNNASHQQRVTYRPAIIYISTKFLYFA